MKFISKHKSYDIIVGCINNGKMKLVSLEVTVSATPQNGQERGFDRVSFWLNDIFNNSFIIGKKDQDLALWKQTNHSLLILPTEQIDDDTVAELLFIKLNAIGDESMLDVEQITVNNLIDRCSTTVFMHQDSVLNELDGWWKESSPNWVDPQNIHLTDSDNIIKLIKIPNWPDIEKSFINENVITNNFRNTNSVTDSDDTE